MDEKDRVMLFMTYAIILDDLQCKIQRAHEHFIHEPRGGLHPRKKKKELEELSRLHQQARNKCEEILKLVAGE